MCCRGCGKHSLHRNLPVICLWPRHQVPLTFGNVSPIDVCGSLVARHVMMRGCVHALNPPSRAALYDRTLSQSGSFPSNIWSKLSCLTQLKQGAIKLCIVMFTSLSFCLISPPVHHWDFSRPQILRKSLTILMCVCLMSQIDGIWHTAVVVRGLEYFYGQGIQISRAGTTPFGVAVQVLDLG